jgi:glycosyltransferase involved in cell wall biosynthesis
MGSALRLAGYDAITLSVRDRNDGNVDEIPVVYLPDRRRRLTRMASGPVTIHRALKLKPDVLYVVSLDLLPWAVLARLLTKRVVVYDSNEQYDTYMLIKEYLPRRVRPMLAGITRWLEPRMGRQLHAVTTALPVTHEKFAEAGARSVLVHNFPPAHMAPRERREPFAHDILYGGSIDEAQIPILAQTAVELERLGVDAKWLVAARNYGPAKRAVLEAELDRRGVRERFDLRYNVPFTDMPELLTSAKVALVSYRGQGIPQRIFEYIGWGIPFVASDLPSTSQFTEGRGVALLAPEGDARAYAGALARLLTDDELRREMSERGPQVAREHFSWDPEAKRFVELFDDLLRG